MQFLQQGRGQHGIAEEGGLYDEELLHSSSIKIITLSMRCPSMSNMRPSFTDTSAISLKEKKPLSRVSRAMIRISMDQGAVA
jgi:hypothetical protein